MYRARGAAARSSTACTTAASSRGGSVFGMHTTAVRTERRRSRAGLDRLGIFATGLAEMDVDVDQAGARRTFRVEHHAPADADSLGQLRR